MTAAIEAVIRGHQSALTARLRGPTISALAARLAAVGVGAPVVNLIMLVTALGRDSRFPTTEIRVPTRVSMLELGFVPTFYQFVDTIIEVKIAIKITRTVEVGRKTTDRESDTRNSNSRKHPFLGGAFGGRSSNSSRTSVSTSQVDATYSAKYSYSAEGSSLLRTKLSPLPPPPVLEDRIRAIMEGEAIRRQAQLDAKNPPPAPNP